MRSYVVLILLVDCSKLFHSWERLYSGCLIWFEACSRSSPRRFRVREQSFSCLSLHLLLHSAISELNRFSSTFWDFSSSRFASWLSLLKISYYSATWKCKHGLNKWKMCARIDSIIKISNNFMQFLNPSLLSLCISGWCSNKTLILPLLDYLPVVLRWQNVSVQFICLTFSATHFLNWLLKAKPRWLIILLEYPYVSNISLNLDSTPSPSKNFLIPSPKTSKYELLCVLLINGLVTPYTISYFWLLYLCIWVIPNYKY